MLFTNLDFIFLQLGDGCISNCSGCSRKNDSYDLWNIYNIKNNINKLIKNNIFSWKLLIYNIDYFDLSNELLSFILSKSSNFSKIYFHTNFRKINYDKLSEEINFLYQRDLNNQEIVFFVKLLLNKKIKNKVNYVLWYDDEKYKIKLLKVLLKYFTFDFNKDTFKIWNNIIKLYNKVWERKKLKKCFYNNSINKNINWIKFWKNFYISCLEILLNWDIRAHEPPCWFWNILISNIHRDNNKIINDFIKFSHYINKFIADNNNISQNKICDKCIQLNYSYE